MSKVKSKCEICADPKTICEYCWTEGFIITDLEAEQCVDALEYYISKYAPRCSPKHRAMIRAIINRLTPEVS